MANDHQNVNGYAPKSADRATSEAGEQTGARNTAPSLKGEAIAAGPVHEECPTPRDPSPYANEARTSAARRDSEGL